mmetsp:Transcript_16022/g.31313  ORF Transcript_16022/g.31313 Transcript_16022/m.31313 type:complete len:612 (+) Transcript_16022:178-2013(+)
MPTPMGTNKKAGTAYAEKRCVCPNTPRADNPARSWLVVETPKAGAPATNPRLLSWPSAAVRTAVRPEQRVIQVCLGVEHGVLLTDAGVAFTWGDNRYGQLGRVPRMIEEDGRPFPVLDLLQEEVTQVAAGKHHCLALATPGLVWSWGRNKHGQLGIGSKRDQVVPRWVRHLHESGSGDGPQLGGEKGKEILSISAGCNSSVASSMNSDIWQWGEIVSGFKITSNAKPGSKEEMMKKKSRAMKLLTGSGASGPTMEVEADPDRPMLVFTRPDYRTRMRKEAVSLVDTGACVIPPGVDLPRIRSLTESVRQMLRNIALWRVDIAKLDADRKPSREPSHKKADNDGGDLKETVAVLEGQLAMVDNDIHLYRKNLESCNLQQEHHRKQLSLLTTQGVDLSQREDTVAVELLKYAQFSVEYTAQEAELEKVKAQIASNANARMAVLDQRTNTEKEKHLIESRLHGKVEEKEQLRSKIKTINDLARDSAKAKNSSDILMAFLRDRRSEIAEHFDGKTPEAEFESAMLEFENDNKFLRKIDGCLEEILSTSSSRNARAAEMAGILRELLEQHRSWSSLLADRWVKDDLDLTCFLTKKSTSSWSGLLPVKDGSMQLALR